MGTYDQLAKLSQTSPQTAPQNVPPSARPSGPQTSTVASLEPSRTAETPTQDKAGISQPQPAAKTPTAPRTAPAPPKGVAGVKLALDTHALRQRIIARASFEVYQDQVHVLRQVSLTAKLAGEKLSISEMVREALDSYLTNKNLT
jgi:hypothetical protein